MKNLIKIQLLQVIYLFLKLFPSKREFYSFQYLKGKGIEVGALSLPLLTKKSATVKYVDRMPIEKLREHYPNLSNYRMVHPHIIDNGEELYSIEVGSKDFVIANHFLEHCENPIFTLKNLFRVLKKDGLLYIAIPNKEQSFDRNREVTPFQHIVDDYTLGPEKMRKHHYIDWVKNVNNITEEHVIKTRVSELMKINFSIHYHVWDDNAFLEFISKANAILGNIYNIELFTRNNAEFIVILRKN